MNKTFIAVSALFMTLTAFSQKYEFHIIKEIKCTPVTAQQNTGTCWSFSSTSFLEAEIIRKTGTTVDLSEMYTVRNIYLDKAENYVMRQGKAQFGEGGLNHDVMNSALKYGLTTQSEYLGKIEANGKIIIDDSFNGNLEGMLEAINISSRAASVDDGKSKSYELIKLVTLHTTQLNLCTILCTVRSINVPSDDLLMICTIVFHIFICILYIVFMNTHPPAIIICLIAIHSLLMIVIKQCRAFDNNAQSIFRFSTFSTLSLGDLQLNQLQRCLFQTSGGLSSLS